MHNSRSVSCWAFLIAVLFNLGPFAAIPTHAEPVFSFWRNLSISDQTYVQLDFQKEAAPLSRELADRCCAVRPGQAVTLVRRGRVVGTGLVGDITAAAVPRAGDDRMVYFDVEGFPDVVFAGAVLVEVDVAAAGEVIAGGEEEAPEKRR